MRAFVQTFVLAPESPKKYYVHNDIFRYQDDDLVSESETNDGPGERERERERERGEESWGGGGGGGGGGCFVWGGWGN